MSNSVQVVNKIQKLRKTAQLEPTDLIDVYYKPVDDCSSRLEEILQSQASQISQIKFLVSETGTSFHENYYFVQDQYIREVLGNSLVPKAMAPSDTVSLYFQPLTFINHQINLN
jgi:isoleucyl-tRNA synthetase